MATTARKNEGFRPSYRYLLKIYLSNFTGTMITFMLLGGTYLFMQSIGQADGEFMEFMEMVEPFFAPIFALMAGYLLLMLPIAVLYFNSIRYEIRNDEIIVASGILNKSVKHVPFRTITNLEVKRDLFDQLLGMGSLSIETAGSGSSIGPEEKLVGMIDVVERYNFVANKLRQFRSAMSPTQSGDDVEVRENQILMAILKELRGIRVELEKRSL
ncbi:MAG: PH domain-containing protein [Aggregatilineales bacterium]